MTIRVTNGTLPCRPISWPHFWKGFLDGLSLAAAIIATISILVAIAAWWTILPSIGFLWLIGAL